MILLLTSHHGVTLSFREKLTSYGLPVHDAQVYSVDEAIGICSREVRPSCLLVIENGFDLDTKAYNGRYQIVERLHRDIPDIPIVFCSQEPDAEFLQWAKERTAVLLSGKVVPERLTAVLEKILAGETPTVEEPHPSGSIKQQETTGRKSLRERFFGSGSKPEPKEVETAPSSFSGREISDDREVMPLEVSSGEHLLMFQDPITPPDTELEQPQAIPEKLPSAAKTMVPEAITETEGNPSVTPSAKQEGLIGGLARAVTSLPAISFGRGKERGHGTEAELEVEKTTPEGDTRQHAIPVPKVQRSSREVAQIVDEKPIASFKFPPQDVIGVFALSRGAGATFTALTIARYLSKRGKTALVAYDGNDDLEFADMDGEDIEICFPSEAERSSAVPILRRNHQFIVVDFGTPVELTPFGMFRESDSTRTKPILNDLMNCNRRVCLAFGAPWHSRKQELLGRMQIDHDCVILTDRQRDMSVDELMGRIYPGLQPGKGIAGIFRSR